MATTAARLRRVTDLFKSGTVFVAGVDPETGEKVPVWIRKPNSFERQEAQRDGLFGQAKLIATLHDESDEIVQVREDAQRRGKDALIKESLDQKQYEYMHMAKKDVEAMEEWQEKLPLIDRAALLEEGSSATEEERRQMAKVYAEYIDAMVAAADERRQSDRADLEALSEDELLQGYIDGYRRLRGMAAFDEEYRLTEMYYAMRACTGLWDEEEKRWEHAECKHDRLFPDRAEVREAPDELMLVAMQTLKDLMMTPAEAGNSDAPSTSSGSSEQPRSAEDSAPSTPAAT